MIELAWSSETPISKRVNRIQFVLVNIETGGHIVYMNLKLPVIGSKTPVHLRDKPKFNCCFIVHCLTNNNNATVTRLKNIDQNWQRQTYTYPFHLSFHFGQQISYWNCFRDEQAYAKWMRLNLTWTNRSFDCVLLTKKHTHTHKYKEITRMNWSRKSNCITRLGERQM